VQWRVYLVLLLLLLLLLSSRLLLFQLTHADFQASDLQRIQLQLLLQCITAAKCLCQVPGCCDHSSSMA
jgi:hypothetical protein